MKHLILLILAAILSFSIIGCATATPEPTVITEATRPEPETSTTAPVETTVFTEPTEEPFPSVIPTEGKSWIKGEFKDALAHVYTNANATVKAGPGNKYQTLGELQWNEKVVRISIGDENWDRIIYNDGVGYVKHKLIGEYSPVDDQTQYPIEYSDDTCNIIITKEWCDTAWVYAAHITFTDYSRFFKAMANGAYNQELQTAIDAANDLDALLVVNGDYSMPKMKHTIVGQGTIYNSDVATCWTPGIYSAATGVLENTLKNTKIAGQNIGTLVESGLVTDTFCYGPAILDNGVVYGNDRKPAPQTFIGTNGQPGDLWICVADGNENDNESTGLTLEQCAWYLSNKGCTFGLPLDGGNHSIMVFRGVPLNANRACEQPLIDFLCFK